MFPIDAKVMTTINIEESDTITASPDLLAALQAQTDSNNNLAASINTLDADVQLLTAAIQSQQPAASDEETEVTSTESSGDDESTDDETSDDESTDDEDSDS